jgi:hypothetical protein
MNIRGVLGKGPLEVLRREGCGGKKHKKYNDKKKNFALSDLKKDC